jgi:hypothetical protein
LKLPSLLVSKSVVNVRYRTLKMAAGTEEIAFVQERPDGVLEDPLCEGVEDSRVKAIQSDPWVVAVQRLDGGLGVDY